MLLQIWGFDSMCANDGAEGLSLARTFSPGIVLLDIGLPNMDGYEVARRLRKSARGDRMTLIALTGYGQEADRARALEAGFDLHLLKPVDPARLRELLAG
jgi:two-component system CheB/CheR fusion protein